MSAAAQNPNGDLRNLLDETIGFMETAILSKQADEQQIAKLAEDLRREKANQERIVLEKVAAAKASVINDQVAGEALARLHGMGVIDDRAMEKIAARIKNDPNTVFPIMVKIAEKLLSSPGEGQGVERIAGDGGTTTGNDVDGWDAFARGEKVQIR